MTSDWTIMSTKWTQNLFWSHKVKQFQKTNKNWLELVSDWTRERSNLPLIRLPQTEMTSGHTISRPLSRLNCVRIRFQAMLFERAMLGWRWFNQRCRWSDHLNLGIKGQTYGQTIYRLQNFFQAINYLYLTHSPLDRTKTTQEIFERYSFQRN